MKKALVIVCTFNYRLLMQEIDNLPHLKQLNQTWAYSSSTWTVPGVQNIITASQEWEQGYNYPFCYQNIDSNWDTVKWGTGRGEIRKFVESDLDGTAFIFYRPLHFPYGLDNSVAMRSIMSDGKRAVKAYKEQLYNLDQEIAPLLDIPCVITGDHGEDFASRAIQYLHHNNSSDEVIKVPFLSNLQIPEAGHSNKHALEILHGKFPKAKEKISIWSEGPNKGQWVFITIHDDNKIVVRPNGIKIEDKFQAPKDHEIMESRLKQLGYL